jgi:hypothetical protein
MPAWVDAVEYGKFGRATVTATLFGGMDDSLYADFQKGVEAQINGAENTLKHTGGHYGPGHSPPMAPSSMSPRQQEKSPWAAAAFKSTLRPT